MIVKKATDALLETSRLLLRPWTIEDTQYWKALSMDVGFTCFSPPGTFAAPDEETLRKKVETRIQIYETNKVGKFLVFRKDDGAFVGCCGADQYPIEGKPQLELGYRLMLDHWGKGYATEAASRYRDYLFRDLKIPVVFAFAHQHNRASLKVLEKLNFSYRGTIECFKIPHELYYSTMSENS